MKTRWEWVNGCMSMDAWTGSRGWKALACLLAERVHLFLEAYSLSFQTVPLPCELLQPLSQGSPLLLPLIMLVLQDTHGVLTARQLLS